MALQDKQKRSNDVLMASAQSSRRSNSFPYKYQFAVLGASRVGKSALVRRWMTPETFIETHYETVDESYEKTVPVGVGNARVQIHVVDTGGSHSFPAMRSLLARDADGFLLVFDTHDRNSFTRVKEIRQEIEEMRRLSRKQHSEAAAAGTNIVSSLPAVLVANKTDGDDTVDSLALRQEAKELARQLGIGYVETSAKNNRNITEIFRCLILRVQNSFAHDFAAMGTKARKNKTVTKRLWRSIRVVFTLPRISPRTMRK
ncbi:ras-like protein 1 [Corticium candelabrum]|uniref:ras-like protein 1 n=1 Tax=Corticium candelabrum TaxID=121492 RepID=UPI002E254B24|nr:ras-like protein 1 [Corticium candelabrum]